MTHLGTTLSPTELDRLIGTPACPRLIDVRDEEDFALDARLLPGAAWRPSAAVESWGQALAGGPVVVLCQRGLKLSEGVAAWLRHMGVPAAVLEGGFEAWRDAGGPLVNAARIPPRDHLGRTVWVTRARPKIDRIACPWLIRRFVDPSAVVLFVAAAQVAAAAERFAATPFDIDGVFWSHRGPACTFDTMLDELGLQTEPLVRLAAIVRGADTARLDLAPQAAGLLAVSLGLSQMFFDDLEQLEAGMLVYDACYRWCRDAVGETHNWPSANTAA